jgi:hypothetical protein
MYLEVPLMQWVEKSNSISSHIGIFVVDNCPDSYWISERYKLCNNNLSIAGPYVVDIMYSVCGFEVASAKYSIGCKPALFALYSFYIFG